MLAGCILRTIHGHEQHFMPKRLVQEPKPSLKIGGISLWETVGGPKRCKRARSISGAGKMGLVVPEKPRC